MNQNSKSPFYSEPGPKGYSMAIRLWHWSNALVITGSLLTVLITSTVLSNDQVSNLIIKGFRKSGFPINYENIKMTAYSITDIFWFLHLYFGYALSGLLLLRLVLEGLRIKEQRLITLLRRIFLRLKAPANGRKERLHDFIIKIIHVFFYLGLIIMVLSGLFIGYGTIFGFYNAVIDDVRMIHGAGCYFMLFFIFIHITGVYLGEKGRFSGIVSGMINGNKPNS